MKAHLRLDGSDEDDLVAAMIGAARLTIEGATRLVLVEQDWRLTLPAWPARRVVRLPIAPVLAVAAVRIAAASGTGEVLDPSFYRLDDIADPPRLLVDAAAPGPASRSDRIEVDLTCGFGSTAEAVPASLRLAVRLVVARWFANRGDAPEPTGEGLPADVRALVAPHVRARIA